MEKSKNLSIIILFIIIITIIIATALKVYNSHMDSNYRVITNEICEATRKCYLDKNCDGNTVKIDELVTKKYLNRQVDPKTKEYIDGNILVNYKDNTCSVDIR